MFYHLPKRRKTPLTPTINPQRRNFKQKAKCDAIYWTIYNLDRKNPNNQADFEHLAPEQLVNDILEKDRRVAEIMSEIKAILG
jgi:hypothetical protein